MKKITMTIASVAMAALMTVPALGMVVNAQETNPQASAASTQTIASTGRSIYFANTKNWNQVAAYTWSDTKGAKVKFPGTEIQPIGKAKINGKVCEIYKYDVKNDDDHIIFSEMDDNHEEPDSINLKYLTNVPECVTLDDQNNVSIIYNFNTKLIKGLNADFTDEEETTTETTPATTPETTPATPATTPAATEKSNHTVESNNRNCYKSNGSAVLYIDASAISNSMPKVTLSDINGSTTQLNLRKFNQINGKYEAEVPQGHYLRATIEVDGQKFTTDITDQTDSVKIANGLAQPCQRVFFKNTLNTKKWANQVIKAYVWNSANGATETAKFEDAYRMTYLRNEGHDNVYFYDVSLAYDHIIFFSADYNTGKVTAQTCDIALNANDFMPMYG